jgi:hypothetical protein
VHTVIPNERE